jgi:hypothetical protein
VRIYAQFWFKLEQVGGDGSEWFVEHADTNTHIYREREREGGHSCLPFDKARLRIFIQFESKRVTMYTMQEKDEKWGKRWIKKSKRECPASDIAWHHTWKTVGVQIEGRKWIIVTMWQQAQNRKEQQCSESDERGNKGGAKERATILNRKIRQIRTYGDKGNNPINNYMSKEMNALSRDIQLVRGQAWYAWCDLTGIEGHPCIIRRQGWANHMALARLVSRGLNCKWEEWGERGAMEAGGKGWGQGKASVAGKINKASWWCSK